MAHEAQSAVFRQFLTSFLSRRYAPLLLAALIGNILLHQYAFSWISETIGLYRDMRLVILGLSMDLFLITLVSSSAGVFRGYRDSGMFQDLHLTGIQPEQVLIAFQRVVMLLIIGDTLVEAAIGCFIERESIGLSLASFGMSCIFGLAAAWLYGNVILLLNLLRRGVGAQVAVFCVLNYLVLLVFGECSERLEAVTMGWNRVGSPGFGFMSWITGNQPGLWPTYSYHVSYSAVAMAESLIFAVAGSAVSAGSRRLRGQYAYWSRK